MGNGVHDLLHMLLIFIFVNKDHFEIVSYVVIASHFILVHVFVFLEDLLTVVTVLELLKVENEVSIKELVL